MHLTTQLWLRLKTLFRRKQLDRDLQDEVAFHLAMREEKNRTDGITAGEERYAARRQFGNITQMKEATRELWTFASLESLWRDLTFALYAFQSPRICRHRHHHAGAGHRRIHGDLQCDRKYPHGALRLPPGQPDDDP